MERTESNIKLARKAYGLTQAKLAELMDIPVRTLQNWENGVHPCSKYMEVLILSKLENIFVQPNYEKFLREIVYMLERDLRTMTTDECKQYICCLIADIKQFLK